MEYVQRAVTNAGCPLRREGFGYAEDGGGIDGRAHKHSRGDIMNKPAHGRSTLSLGEFLAEHLQAQRVGQFQFLPRGVDPRQATNCDGFDGFRRIALGQYNFTSTPVSRYVDISNAPRVAR